MVYVDDLVPCVPNARWRYNRSCHLIADTEEELLTFAASIGLRGDWIQSTSIPHFDLNTTKRREAIVHGATPLTRTQFYQMVRGLKGHKQNGE